MKTEDFDLFQALLKQRSGLMLTSDKAYLLESRLLPVARKRNLKGLEELAAAIRTRKDESLLRDVTEAMTTNESSFFRDSKPFELFRQVVLRSEEHTSELQSLMRISYAVFCLKKKTKPNKNKI